MGLDRKERRAGDIEERAHSTFQARCCWGTEGHRIQAERPAIVCLSARDLVRRRQAKSKDQKVLLLKWPESPRAQL